MLYDTLCNLETLGVCRRGYFIEGMGGAQFALPGAVERLRGARTPSSAPAGEGERALVIAAADPAQPYGAALPWPKREGQERRPARVAGAYVVLIDDRPALYLERGGRGLLTLADAAGVPRVTREQEPLIAGLRALAEAVRAGRVPKLALERIDGEPAIGSELVGTLRELGFQTGPRRLTLSA
jgi:ATP-dependent helicase Lhr and Lhr-like helicase